MRYVLAILALISWALWFGGLIAVFLAVTALFDERRDIAGPAGQVIFPTFGRFCIPVAAIAILSVAGIRLAGKKSLATVAFALLGIATIALVTSSIRITPAIREMFLRGETHTPQFKKMHGISMLVHVIQAGALLIVGLLLPTILKAFLAPAETPPAAAPGTDPRT